MSDWDSVRIHDLERFAAVVEAGGFTAAASGLGESPKQLSRRIGQLEEHLGTRLFHRTTRLVRPTPEATEWYRDVRAALDQLQRATEDLRPMAELRGRVRVQVPTLFVDPVLDWVTSELAANPGLALDVLVGDRGDDLLGRGIDVCLSGVPPQGATVLVRRVGTARPMLSAHPRYLERAGVPLGPDDLQHHECLRFVGPSPQTHWSLSHQDGRQVDVPVGGRFACNDSRALLRALVSGLGIGPLAAAPVSLAPGVSLVPVLPGWSLGGIVMHLALAPGRARLRRVRHVADGLEQIVGRMVAEMGGLTR